MCQTRKYNTGDILVVGTWPIPIFNHFAIVLYKNGTGYVAHNSFRSKKIIISGLDEFVRTRNVRQVIPTNGTLTDDYIYNKTVELNKQGKTYNFFGYNCEEYVREICSCSWGTDQRKEFILFFIVLLALAIVFYKLLK